MQLPLIQVKSSNRVRRIFNVHLGRRTLTESHPGIECLSLFLSLLESSNLLHDKLGHVNNDTLHRLTNLITIPTFQIDSNHKCEIYIETKLTRSSFQEIERNTKSLYLIHRVMCAILKLIQMRGDSKYFITLVDARIKYCYVY